MKSRLARILRAATSLAQYPQNWATARQLRQPRLETGGSASRRRFGYPSALLPNPVLADADAGRTDLSGAVAATGLSMGYPAWNLLYYVLFCSLAGGEDAEVVVVETGTNHGFSTIALAQALKDGGARGVVDTVDIDGAVVELAKQNVARAGLDAYARFHTGDSAAFLRELVRERPRIDFAFLDGSHDEMDVRREFDILFPAIVAARGTVYFDNTGWGGVAGALRHIRRAYPGNLIELRNCSWSPPGNAIWQPD
jgi:predicted O-methyltransferase YrrM